MTQPEALRLAAVAICDRSIGWQADATAELRRLHAENEKLRAALRAALEQEPVQEPVAWQWLDTAHFRKKIPAHATPAHWRPLFTAPPQRKPLTVTKLLPRKLPEDNDE